AVLRYASFCTQESCYAATCASGPLFLLPRIASEHYSGLGILWCNERSLVLSPHILGPHPYPYHAASSLGPSFPCRGRLHERRLQFRRSFVLFHSLYHSGSYPRPRL